MNLIAFDTETHLIQAGLLAPPGVCGAFARRKPDGNIDAELHLWSETLRRVAKVLASDALVAGANIAYDMAVIGASNADLLPIIFDKYERGEIFDIQLALALHAVAHGHLFRDPKTGAWIGRYSQNTVVKQVLGRDDAKVNNEYVARYHELENLPLDKWPEVARQYPIDDATWCLLAAERLIEVGDNLGTVARGDQPHPLGITHITRECRAALAMHLAGVWGLRTDPEAVAAVEAKVEKKHAEDAEKFQQAGFLRPDGSKDTAAVKRRVIQAYGGGAACETCAGSGKVPSPTNPKNKINCKGCGGAGLAVPSSVPRTDKDGISTSRDTLIESGDDLLEDFAWVSMNEKIRATYIPFLKQGTERAITLKANAIVESDRTSYDGIIQLLPREGGIRECFVPREGYVYCSVDYSALELCTFSQVCLWVLGHSSMADAINEAKNPGVLHTILAARMIGADVDEFVRLYKSGDKDAAFKRQMAKALNFGRLGGMGAAKLVLAKRKDPGTTKSKSGKEYSGLRFCLAQGVADECGIEKVTEWNGRPCPPVCLACVEVADQLIHQFDNEWWPEVKEYFAWVSNQDGVDEGNATIMSPGTGYIRGGLHFTNLANHNFQHLAAAGAKHAMWLVSKECYTDKASPLYGTRPIVFAHDEIVSEIPEHLAHEAAHRKAAVMIAAMREFVPDVHIAAEPAIARRWYKGMEPVFENGRLVPWEPKEKK